MNYSLNNRIVFNANTDMLLTDGQERKLEPQVSQMLLLLIQCNGKVCSREQILTTIWPDRVVTDDSIRALVKKLREQLQDDVRSPQYIKTVPRIGYQLICPVVERIESKSIETKNQLNWFNKGIAVVAAFAVLAVLVNFSFSSLQTEETVNELGTQTKQTSTVLLTQMPGSEVGPDYSLDSQLLVFSHRHNQTDTLSLYVKELPNGETKRLTWDNFNYINAKWRAKGDKLVYTRFSGTEVQHMLADYHTDSGITVTGSLPNSLSNYAIVSIGNDNNVYLKSTSSPSHILQYNLVNGESRKLTSPSDGGGDVFASPSPDASKLAILRAPNLQTSELLIVDLATAAIEFAEFLPINASKLVWSDSGESLLLSAFKGDITQLELESGSLSDVDVNDKNINDVFHVCAPNCFFARQHNGNYLDLAEQPLPFGGTTPQSTRDLSLPSVQDFPIYGGGETFYFAQPSSNSIEVMVKRPNSPASVAFELAGNASLQSLAINQHSTHIAGKKGERIFVFDIKQNDLHWLTDKEEASSFPHFNRDGTELMFAKAVSGIYQFQKYILDEKRMESFSGGTQYRYHWLNAEKENAIIEIDFQNRVWVQVGKQDKRQIDTLPSSSPNRFSIYQNWLYYTDRTGNDAYINRVNMDTAEKQRTLLAKNRFRLNFDISPSGEKLLGVRSILAQSNIIKVEINE